VESRHPVHIHRSLEVFELHLQPRSDGQLKALAEANWEQDPHEAAGTFDLEEYVLRRIAFQFGHIHPRVEKVNDGIREPETEVGPVRVERSPAGRTPAFG
jgi:hypothetical protein